MIKYFPVYTLFLMLAFLTSSGNRFCRNRWILVAAVLFKYTVNYGYFQSLRIRKKDRSPLLKSIIDYIERRMDDSDEHRSLGSLSG